MARGHGIRRRVFAAARSARRLRRGVLRQRGADRGFDVIVVAFSTTSRDPLQRFRALGRIVSDRSLIDYDSSESLRGDNDTLRARMEDLLREAQRAGELRSDDVTHLPLFGRALVYGMARMLSDGHMAQWNVGKRKVEDSFAVVLDLFISGLARERRSR